MNSFIIDLQIGIVATAQITKSVFVTDQHPVFPANGAYVFGSPLFTKVSIALLGHKLFTVKAVGNSPKNMYIQKAQWNGKPYDKTYIRYEDIMRGGTLTFTMGSQPNKRYGNATGARPKSVYP